MDSFIAIFITNGIIFRLKKLIKIENEEIYKRNTEKIFPTIMLSV